MSRFFLIIFFCIISCRIFADDKVVTIAVREFPPFEFLDNNKITGINVTTITEVLKRAGYEAEFIILPWKRAIASTENGETDAIASIKKTSERDNSFIFSKPLMYTKDYFFKSKNLNITPRSLNDLKSYNIGIVDKYPYGTAFEKENFPKLSPITSLTPEVDNLEKLQSGRVDLALCPIDICTYWLNKYPKLFSDIDYLESPSADSDQALYIAFSRKNSFRSNEIVENFNKELVKYIAEGKVKRNILKFAPENDLKSIPKHF